MRPSVSLPNEVRKSVPAPLHPKAIRSEDSPTESSFSELIEKQSETVFRVHVRGQQDERGRNRAATWYCFRMDHVQGRDHVARRPGPGEA